MNPDFQSPPAPAPLPEEPKKGPNTWLIVGIVAVVLCCCCIITLALLYQFGDQILQTINFSSSGF